MAPAARDRKSLLALIEKAQLVYLLTRYPKKQVLDDAKDVVRLEEGLTDMRAAAKALPARFREEHARVPWDELAKQPDDPDLAWRRARRVAPTVLRELMPVLEGEPEAAFFLRPQESAKLAKEKAAKKKATRPKPRAVSGRSRSARAAR